MEEVTLKESSVTQTAGEISTKVTEVNKKGNRGEYCRYKCEKTPLRLHPVLPELHPVKRARLQIRQLMQKQSADNAAKVLEDVTLKERLYHPDSRKHNIAGYGSHEESSSSEYRCYNRFN